MWRLLVAVFLFFSSIAQAASLLQGAAAPETFHSLVDVLGPVNSFAAGVLWTRIAAMKEDITELKLLVNKLLAGGK